MPASQNFLLAKGRDADGPITKKRFVKYTGDQLVAQCDSAGETACGASLFSASQDEIDAGKGASIMTEGRVVVTAAEAISEGQPVATDANGKAVVAGAGDVVLGTCDESSSGADTECSVHLWAGAGTTVFTDTTV